MDLSIMNKASVHLLSQPCPTRVSVSPVSSTACICKGQIRDWSHKGQNSPLCSSPIHHSLICNIIHELMCLAHFINIHWHEITKVSLEVELGVLRNYLEQFVNSVEVIGIQSYNMNIVLNTKFCLPSYCLEKTGR